jgi:phosphoribosylamine--glycine ligase
MKVLLVGGGGREHALAWKLAQSPRLERLIAAPGTPGIARHAECVAITDTAIEPLVALARREQVDLVGVGPEQPLSGSRTGSAKRGSPCSDRAPEPRGSRARRCSRRS